MKTLRLLALVLVIFSGALSAYAQRAVMYDKIALDDDMKVTIAFIEKTYKGKYTIDEWGGYIVTLDANTTLKVYAEEGKVDAIIVEKKNCDYSFFLSLAQKIITKYGEPKGMYTDEDGYNIYWWGYIKKPEEPSFDVKISINWEKPFTIREMLYHGK